MHLINDKYETALMRLCNYNPEHLDNEIFSDMVK